MSANLYQEPSPGSPSPPIMAGWTYEFEYLGKTRTGVFVGIIANRDLLLRDGGYYLLVKDGEETFGIWGRDVLAVRKVPEPPKVGGNRL